MTDVRRRLLGKHGFERATVWSVVGFALSLAAFRALAVFGALGPLGGVDSAWLAVGCAGLAATGVVAFARTGGGALPCALLAYGPFSAVLLETVGPDIRLERGGGVTMDTAAGTGLLTDAVTLLDPFAIAVAAAVAVGGAGYVVGRGLAGVFGSEGETNIDRKGDRDDDADGDEATPGDETGAERSSGGRHEVSTGDD